MSKKIKRKQLIKMLEAKLAEAELDLQYEDHQHSRAYHTGLIDGLGEALVLLRPESRRLPITIAWYQEDEPTQTMALERQREYIFETMEAS
jgi:hypothetical protein